jgi:hypothetical protein
LIQKPLYFRNKGQLIAATLHLPKGRRSCPAVAILHGFTAQRCEWYFTFVKLSRRLAEEGIASLRLDARGSGESEGEFEDMTPLEEVSDLRAALRRLRKTPRVDPRRLALLGMSMGGMVAALASAHEPSLKSLVLWAAVARPDKVFRAMTTKAQMETLAKAGRLDVRGLYVGRGFWECIKRIDPPAALAKAKAPALIIHGTGDGTVAYSDSSLFLKAGLSRGIRTERLTVPGADHAFPSAVWRNEVIDATVNWLKETLL